MNQQRKYQAIWERLKRSQACAVGVHKAIVARVIKAVIKEKYNDTAFRLANANSAELIRLRIKKIKLGDGKHTRVEFRLTQRFGLEDIKTIEEIEL